MQVDSRLVPKEDVTARLIEVFKNLISDGTLAPGGRVPPERDLAERFGVSRSSLRQALKVLEIMGVISQRVGDGTYLNAGATSILKEPMEFLILIDDISFHELMEARLIAEPELAARAANRATAEDIAELTRVHEHMEHQKADLTRFVEYDLLFHQTIFRIAGNRVCSSMFSVVHRSIHELMVLTSQLVEPEHTLRLHHRILIAIRKGAADQARSRMVEHLEDATSIFVRAAAQEGEERILKRLNKLPSNADRKPVRLPR